MLAPQVKPLYCLKTKIKLKLVWSHSMTSSLADMASTHSWEASIDLLGFLYVIFKKTVGHKMSMNQYEFSWERMLKTGFECMHCLKKIT